MSDALVRCPPMDMKNNTFNMLGKRMRATDQFRGCYFKKHPLYALDAFLGSNEVHLPSPTLEHYTTANKSVGTVQAANALL